MKRVKNTLVLFCAFFMFFSNIVRAEEGDYEKANAKVERASEYVLTHFDELLEILEDDKLFQTRTEADDLFELGTPFIIYHADEEMQEEIFYYPIVDVTKGKVVYLIEAIKKDGIYICNLLDHLVDALNRVDYVTDGGVVYLIGKDIYIDNGYEILNTTEYYNGSLSETELFCIENDFAELTLEEKKSIVNDRISNLKEFQNYQWRSSTEKLNVKAYGSITLVKPQGQHGFDMCWASAVATIHNYLQPTVVLTGYDICNRMGIGYNDGGTIYDEQEALALFSIDYNVINDDILSWEELTGNINVGYPVIANGADYRGVAHAVTIYGYLGNKDSAENVQIWNSNLNAGLGGEAKFTYTGLYFPGGDGNSYYWNTTLSYQ